MAALSTLYPQLVPELPQVPTPILKQALEQAARDFCRDTSAWRDDLTPILTVADQAVYTLTSDEAEAVIHQVLTCDVETTEDWRYTVDRRAGTITLDPAPQTTGENIQLEVVYQPLPTVTTLPDFLMERYQHLLVYRVLARLKSRRRMPWNDPDGARYYERMYQDEVGDLLIDEIIETNNGEIVMGVTHVL